MKHIRKIISISVALREKFGWDIDRINLFITEMNILEYNMRRLNEALSNEQDDESMQERMLLEGDIRTYLLDLGIIDNPDKVAFSHSPMDTPIKISLGAKYANHSDDVSFVINL